MNKLEVSKCWRQSSKKILIISCIIGAGVASQVLKGFCETTELLACVAGGIVSVREIRL